MALTLSTRYVNLHSHTDMSNIRLLDCIMTPEILIDTAHDLGMRGVAVTDHDALGNHVKALKHLKKRKQEFPEDESWQNFKLVLGNEIYLVRNGLSKDTFVSGVDRFYHFILLAKDEIGHRQLRQLSSKAWRQSFYRFMERVPTYYSDLQEIIGADPGHVIGSTACLGGLFGATVLEAHKYKKKDPELYQEHMDRLESWLEWCLEIFGKDNFFLEKQPSENKEQWIVNKAIEEFSSKLGIPCIITTDAHYATEADRPVHKAYLNAKQGDREVDEFYASTYLMSTKQIVEYFQLADKKYGRTHETADVADLVIRDLENTITLIADKVESYDLAHSPIIPHAKLDWQTLKPITDTYTDYPFIQHFVESTHEQDRYFIARVIDGLNKKIRIPFADAVYHKYLTRINIECKELWNISTKLGQQLSSYLLLIADIIDIVWDEGDSLVNPGRGSSSGFLCNYFLGIIQVDPLEAEVELPYWRFINEHRVSLPDIDIDIESGKRARVFKAFGKRFGFDRVVNVATFGTEKPKSAIKTAARGLGISDDEATYLSSMVPVERGFPWPLKDCFYGNEEEGRAPIAQFRNEMTNTYPELWTVAQKIEGLISRRGIHAAGVLISNEDFFEHNAIMKAPNGAWTSQFELGDTEYMGGTKLDLLSLEALDKIRVTLDLLVEYEYIERKESLKETYMSILDPSRKDILDYDNPEIWDLAARGEILSLFQFDTPVGMTAVKQVKPRDIAELSAINSLMRLTASEGEMPLDTFMQHKHNPGLWESEMELAGLTTEEQGLMVEHLGSRYGVAESQEAMMILAMDKNIAGFTVAEADALRKAVAKKSFDDFEKLQALFYERGRKLGTSNALLRYVWEVQIKRQKGYSFSQNHTYVYSLVALQQLNLAVRYPVLFWNVANLIVDSGGIEAEAVESEDMYGDDLPTTQPEQVDDDEDEDVEEGEEVEVVVKPKEKVKSKAVDYGKIGMALGKMKSAGIQIDPPDINRSKYTFTPDVDANSILFGIKGITSINDTLVRNIIDNRPYTSLEDLRTKVKLTKPQIINLIKSGALDKIRGKDRVDIMSDYLEEIADIKKTLNLRNMQMLIERNLIPIELDFNRRLYNFNKYLKKLKTGIYYEMDDVAMKFFEEYYDNGLLNVLDDGKLGIVQKTWDKIYTKGMDPMRNYIKANLAELLEKVNGNVLADLWAKYASGGLSKWEMDSLSFYDHAHELADVNFGEYGIEDFFAHGEEPEVVTFKNFGGRSIPIFNLYRIAGTVLHRDKTKHLVSILTPTGVVNVRIWQNQFVKYDKQLSIKLPNGKKKIVEKSWFSRGNKIMFTGIRRGDNFFPKVYENGRYPYPVELITGLTKDDELILKGERTEDDWTA